MSTSVTKKSNSRSKYLRQEEDEGSLLNFTDIIGLCISNWLWFVVCLAITLSSAAIYLRMTPPVYTRSTSIVVKDDNNTESYESLFARARGKVNSNTSMKNEMIALQKETLMRRVVERLNIDYQYAIVGRLRTTTLYGSTLPFTAEIQGNHVATFRVRLLKNNEVLIKCDDRFGSSKEFLGKMNSPIKTSVGTITIKPTKAYNTTSDDDITVNHISSESAAAMFLSRLMVANSDEESSVIDLSISDVCIERADDILNTLIAVYNENWITNRNQVIVSTNKFIGERLEAIERELGDVENEMTNYKVGNHTLDFASEGQMYMGRSMQFETQNMGYENELVLSQYFRKYIANIKNYSQTLPLSAGINNTALTQQVNQYNTLVMNRSNLVASSTEANPLVTDIDKQLAVLHHGILITIDNHISSLSTQVNLLHANDATNNQKIDEQPTKQKQYVDIERRRKIKEQLYTFLLQTREQNELKQAFEAYNTRVLQPATGSNFQSFPNVKKIWLIALAVGFGLPLLIIVLREFFNSKVRGRRDIERLTIPFIGEIPNVEFGDEEHVGIIRKFITNVIDSIRARKGKKKRKKRNDKNRVVVKHGSRNVINEAFRVLRTNVEFVIGQDKNTKVIMTTSANPGSGKTFISYNLAYCMALKGKRVCCIDLDLRRRSLSDYVGKPDKGVSDYINGAVGDWHNLLCQPEDGKEFYILPVGTLPPNPAEIISYDRFGELIQEIREEFDYVFFDCPPVEIVADTSILARHADVTLFVIRVGVMELEFLNIIEDYYNDRKYNNMGIILNGTLTANSRYGYRRYGYRYGYGYGYGYGGYGYGSSYSDSYSKKD